MFTENGKGTIFDNIKSSKIIKANIPEDEIIKPTKMFTVNNDKFDYNLIVNDYKIPSFKYIDDNSLNDFYEFPDIYISQNTEYKYKYPHLSKGEYIKEQWQTEAGTPNELNRFMRQEQTGKSLDDIKAEDNVYESGLKQIQKMIDEDNKTFYDDYNSHLKIIKSIIETDEEKEARLKKLDEEKENIEARKKSKNERTLNRYTKRNPVLIHPVIQKSKEEFMKNSEARLKQLEENKQKNKESKERMKDFKERYIERKKAETEELNKKRKIMLENHKLNKIEKYDEEKEKREVNLLNEMKNDAVYLKTVRRPKLKSTELQQALLQKEIKKGLDLKKTPQPEQKPISTDLTDKQIEENKEAFKKAIAEGKEKLKNRKAEEYNKEKSKRYLNLQEVYKEESKKQVAHENLILKGYDEVINKLEDLNTKKLSEKQRKEINEMLKNIDGTNIGAINQVKKAIERLKSKKDIIEEHRKKILDQLKKQDQERKEPRRVEKNTKIMQLPAPSLQAEPKTPTRTPAKK